MHIHHLMHQYLSFHFQFVSSNVKNSKCKLDETITLGVNSMVVIIIILK